MSGQATRVRSFGGAVAFAAAAGAGWPVFALVFGPFAGAHAALGLYLVAAAALHAFAIAGDRARAAAAALVVAALGVLCLAVARDAWELAAGAALALGVARGALLQRARPARALVAEVALLGAGLLLARWLATPGLLGIALAVWGFFLVQAGFFLVPGERERRADAAGGDGFEHARRRLVALLEEDRA